MNSKARLLIFLIPIIVVVLLGAILVPRFLKKGKSQPKNIELTYWGLFEPEEVMKPLIDEYIKIFEGKNLGTTLNIKYEQRTFDSLEQYRETVKGRLTTGEPIDIVRLHSTWIPEFAPVLSPLPTEVMKSEEYAGAFYRVATTGATVNGQIYGIPLMYDGLVLLCNSDLFAKAGLSVPKPDDRISWLQFEEYARQLTKVSGTRIVQAGAGLGTANNVPFATDILGLMLAQVDVTGLTNLDSPQAADALKLYSTFAKDSKVWDSTSFVSTLDAFTQNKLGMMFTPAWQILNIVELNPQIHLVVVPPPQARNSTGKSANWGSFWFESVNKESKNSAVAWDFLKFLSSSETEKKFYSKASTLRKFGEAYSRVDLKDSLATHEILGPVVKGADTASTWYITDYSGNGVFTDLVSATIDQASKGGDPATLMKDLKLQLIQEAKKKGYQVPAVTTPVK